ncbi:MAG: hypothetical protein ACE15C_01800 [Phycisphaerae bacterium]
MSVFSPDFRLFHHSRRSWHIAHGSYRRYFTGADIRRLFGADFQMLQLMEERGEGGGFWHALMVVKPGQ